CFVPDVVVLVLRLTLAKELCPFSSLFVDGMGAVPRNEAFQTRVQSTVPGKEPAERRFVGRVTSRSRDVGTEGSVTTQRADDLLPLHRVVLERVLLVVHPHMVDVNLSDDPALIR